MLLRCYTTILIQEPKNQGLDNVDEEEHGGKWLSVDSYINSGSLMAITFRTDDSDEVVTNIKI